MTKLLEGKSAIIYGGGGGIGGGVARTFAREGAQVFLVGRTREALDQVATRDHLRAVALPRSRCWTRSTNRRWMRMCAMWSSAPAGSTCRSISITRGDVQGVPLVEMSTDDLMRAVDKGLRSSFISARAAGRQMIQQGAGRDSSPQQRLGGGGDAGDGQHRAGRRGDRGVHAVPGGGARSQRRAGVWNLDGCCDRDADPREAGGGRRRERARSRDGGADDRRDRGAAACTPVGRCGRGGGVSGIRPGRAA